MTNGNVLGSVLVEVDVDLVLVAMETNGLFAAITTLFVAAAEAVLVTGRVL